MRCWQAIFHLTGNWSVSRNIRDLGVHYKSLCGLETLMSDVLGLRICFLCGQGASHCDTQAEICVSIKWLIYMWEVRMKRAFQFFPCLENEEEAGKTLKYTSSRPKVGSSMFLRWRLARVSSFATAATAWYFPSLSSVGWEVVRSGDTDVVNLLKSGYY